MKSIRTFLFFSVAFAVIQTTISSSGSTLLLVPREDVPVKLGLDVGNRFPTLLLTYASKPEGKLSLHGWSGEEWVNITPASYQEGSFFTTAPMSALVVAEEGMELPSQLIPDEAWCPEVYRISTEKLRPLIHLLGRRYDFKYKDWKWFSDNYHLPLDSINPDGLNMAWYHRNLVDNMKSKGANDYADLGFLKVVRLPLLDDDTIKTEEPDDDAQAVIGVESGEAESTTEVVLDNPLTNDVPQAVIIGDGADENAVAETPDEADAGEKTEQMQE